MTAADVTCCCRALIIRRWEWGFLRPRRYRVCMACGYEVDAGGWPVQGEGHGMIA